MSNTTPDSSPITPPSLLRRGGQGGEVLDFQHPGFSGIIGIARADITPPVGIYARNWGAAEHDVAAGVHRPLTLTVLSLQTAHDTEPIVLAGADLGWWRDPADEQSLRSAVLSALSLDPARLLLNLSHTHAGPVLCRADADRPGGDLIPTYLDRFQETLIATISRALSVARQAVLEFATGHCSLAAERDLPESSSGHRFLCGYNPEGGADDTLLVGRITDMSGETMGTLVNYACHPTTLAHENRLLSPDFVGAMREVVERETGSSPCLFLQGASGELAPREQYTTDVRIVDQHGRQLGFAVLEVLMGMTPPNTTLRFSHVVESGAPLAIWQTVARNTTTNSIRARCVPVEMSIKSEWQAETNEERTWAASHDAALQERLRRRRRIRMALGGGETAEIKTWVWQAGDVLLFAHPTEAYSLLQTTLRKHFPTKAVVVLNVTNGWYGYLPPESLYGENIYPVWQTPFAAGSLERLIAAAIHNL